MQIGECIRRGSYHWPGLRCFVVFCLMIPLVLRTRTKGDELQEIFPDARLESSHRGRTDRGRQVLDEHSVVLGSALTHRRPFTFLLFVLGGKGQYFPRLAAHCLVLSRHSKSAYLIELNCIKGTFRANYQLQSTH